MQRRPALAWVLAAGLGAAASLPATASWAQSELAARVDGEPALARAERLVPYAETVVRGRCRATRARWDAAQRVIVTDAEIAVEETVVGPPRRSLVVTEPGGALPERNLGMAVPDAPRFAPGDDVVLFVGRDARGDRRVVGGAAGRLAVTRDGVGGELRAGGASWTQLRARIRASAAGR